MHCEVGSRFTLEEAAGALGTSPPVGAAGVEISGVCIDSRDAAPGMLFVALEGEVTDGHHYVEEAFRSGASAALIREGRAPKGGQVGPLLQTADPLTALGALAHWYRSRFSLHSVAITGSMGKTTCKDFIAACLCGRYCTLKTRGNYNTEIGVPLTLFRLGEQHDAVVLELAMRNLGDIEYLTGMASPEVGVLTNISESHLENLGSVDNIARAKAELFRGLPERGWAVINAGDSWGEWVAERTPAHVRYYALEPGEDVDVWVENVRLDRWAHAVFTIRFCGGDKLQVRLPVAGKHHVENALAAAAVAELLGASGEEIANGLENAELTGMRMQWLRSGGIFILNDAYNSSPASCRGALDTLSRSRVGRRRTAILGDMLELGQRTTDAHREVGEIAADSGLDLLLTVGEKSRETGTSAVNSGLSPGAHRHYPTREDLIADLSRRIEPEDAVLVKASRGCELELVVEALARLFPAAEGDRS